MSVKSKKLVLYFLFFANLGVILTFWLNGSGDLMLESLPGAAIALGRLFGLLAAFGVLLQMVLIGRSLWLERVFGLDKLALVHQKVGKTAIIFLLLHPVFLIWGYGAVSGVSFLSQLSDFLKNYPFVLWAALGLALFMVVVATSLLIVRARLKYETWYFVHLTVYGAIFLSFWHQINLGSDLILSRFFYGYWITLYVLVLANHLLFRFARPLYLFARHKFYVREIVRENHNVVSIYLSGRNLAKFKAKAGQFMIMRFLAPGFWWQAHPFSISQMPDGQRLRITPKQLGDYTNRLPELKPGTKVIIDGAYGRFVAESSAKNKVLFIAGGIGITPIRSLIEDMGRGKDMVLLYGNKTERDVVFKEELDVLAEKTGVRVVHVLSDEPNFTGERGYIDKDKLAALVPDVAEREVFLCGPPPMMTKVRAHLQELKVARQFVHFEKFSLQ